MSQCPSCNQTFRCGVVDGNENEPCWCMDLPPLPSSAYPDSSGKPAACLCPACLRSLLAAGKQIEN